MKRRITTLLLALTLATTMLIGGLTSASPASANSFTLSASQCNYIGNYCHLQAQSGGTGTVYITWMKYWNSCACYTYDSQSVYVSGGYWFATNTWVYGDMQVIQVTINAPLRIYYESVGPIYWYSA